MGSRTRVAVEQKEKPKNNVQYDVSFADIIGQETAKHSRSRSWRGS